MTKLTPVRGVVTDSNRGRLKVLLDTGHQISAYPTGTLRKLHVVAGDRVRVELSPYDLSLGRVVYVER